METGPGKICADGVREDVWRLGQGRFVESWSEEKCGDWAMRYLKTGSDMSGDWARGDV